MDLEGQGTEISISTAFKSQIDAGTYSPGAIIRWQYWFEDAWVSLGPQNDNINRNINNIFLYDMAIRGNGKNIEDKWEDVGQTPGLNGTNITYLWNQNKLKLKVRTPVQGFKQHALQVLTMAITLGQGFAETEYDCRAVFKYTVGSKVEDIVLAATAEPIGYISQQGIIPATAPHLQQNHSIVDIHSLETVDGIVDYGKIPVCTDLTMAYDNYFIFSSFNNIIRYILLLSKKSRKTNDTVGQGNNYSKCQFVEGDDPYVISDNDIEDNLNAKLENVDYNATIHMPGEQHGPEQVEQLCNTGESNYRQCEGVYDTICRNPEVFLKKVLPPLYCFDNNVAYENASISERPSKESDKWVKCSNPMDGHCLLWTIYRFMKACRVENRNDECKRVMTSENPIYELRVMIDDYYTKEMSEWANKGKDTTSIHYERLERNKRNNEKGKDAAAAFQSVDSDGWLDPNICRLFANKFNIIFCVWMPFPHQQKAQGWLIMAPSNDMKNPLPFCKFDELHIIYNIDLICFIDMRGGGHFDSLVPSSSIVNSFVNKSIARDNIWDSDDLGNYRQQIVLNDWFSIPKIDLGLGNASTRYFSNPEAGDILYEVGGGTYGPINFVEYNGAQPFLDSNAYHTVDDSTHDADEEALQQGIQQSLAETDSSIPDSGSDSGQDYDYSSASDSDSDSDSDKNVLVLIGSKML